jgi:2,3-bisphosphoglycerate-independent phosphoglycerate mutase
VTTYSEKAAKDGSLGVLDGDEFINIFLKN